MVQQRNTQHSTAPSADKKHHGSGHLHISIPAELGHGSHDVWNPAQVEDLLSGHSGHVSLGWTAVGAGQRELPFKKQQAKSTESQTSFFCFRDFELW